MVKISSEQEMLSFARDFAKKLKTPAVIELVGDVGAGKTTFTRGLAEGLGVAEPVTSPSFTISKRYAFSRPIPDTSAAPNFAPADTPTDLAPGESAPKTPNSRPCTLVHYDFYRLPDPGLMSEDLGESLNDKKAITVVEWADSVSDLLPEGCITLKITLNDDGSRTIEQS